MKNKKGVVHVGAIIAIVIILLVTAAGVGYYLYQKNMPTVAVGEDGVAVNVDGVAVQTGENGVSVDIPGFSAQVDGDNVSMDAPGMNANIDGDSVSLNTGGTSVNSQSTEGSAQSNKKVNTVLIFDASGSMAEQIEGKSRMDIAKESMAKYVTSLDDDKYLSVVAYGHKGNNTQAGKAESCSGIEELYYMGAVDDQVVAGKINKLTPNGWTPITGALQKASQILQKNSMPGVQKHIVLLSDGEETCGGDPVAVAKQLSADGITIDVIGLDVDEAVKSQLNNISISGGGVYYSVGDSDEFSTVIDDMGVKLNTGNLNVRVDDDGVMVQGDNGFMVETNDDGASVQMEGLDVQTTNDGVSVDVPGVSIPSF
jgi:hypothetical protein